MKIRIRLFILALFVFVPSVLAQTGGSESQSPGGANTAAPTAQSLTADAPITVHLTGSTPVDLLYKSNDGETVTVTARSLEPGDTLDVTLAVIDAEGSQIAFNDDHGTSRADLGLRDALISGLTLPAAGKYIVEVASYSSTANGDVEVSLTTGDAAQATPVPQPVPQEETAGIDLAISDRVPDGGDYTTTFDASAGDVLTITVRATDNQLDPKVTLLDASGAQVAFNDDHEEPDNSLGTFDSQIVGFTIPATGTYTVQIIGVAGVVGAFDLSVQSGSFDTPAPQPTPAQNATPAPEGAIQIVDGSINPNDVYTYNFDAQASEVYTITVQAMTDGFDPRVIVYLNDDYIADNDDYGSRDSNLQPTDARIYNLIIHETGRYEIDVRGYQDSAGSFRLTIEQTATDAPTGLPEETAELGSISAGEAYQTNFQAEFGDYVTLTARGLTQDFDTYVALLDENGTVLIDNDDNGTNAADIAFYDSRIPNFRIPADGVYTVEVTDARGNPGAFGLTISKLH